MIDYATFNRNMMQKALGQAQAPAMQPAPPVQPAMQQAPPAPAPVPEPGTDENPLVPINNPQGQIVYVPGLQLQQLDQLPEKYTPNEGPVLTGDRAANAMASEYYIEHPRQAQEVQALFGIGTVDQAPKPTTLQTEGGPDVTNAVYGAPTDPNVVKMGVGWEIGSPDAAVRVLASAPDGSYTDEEGNPVPQSYWRDLLARADAGEIDLGRVDAENPDAIQPVRFDEAQAKPSNKLPDEPIYKARKLVDPEDYVLAQSTQGGQTITLAMTLDQWDTYYNNDNQWSIIKDDPTTEDINQPTVRLPSEDDFAIQQAKGIEPAEVSRGPLLGDLPSKVGDTVSGVVESGRGAISRGYDATMGNLAYQYAKGDMNDIIATGALPGTSADFVTNNRDAVMQVYESGYDRDGDGQVDVEAGPNAAWALIEDNGEGLVNTAGEAWGVLDELRQGVRTEYADAVSKYATGQDMGKEDWFDLVFGTAIFGTVEEVSNVIDVATPWGSNDKGVLNYEWTTFGNWARENPDLVNELLANGYEAEDGTVWEAGPTAVWEAYVGTLPAWRRASVDLAMDPLSYTPATAARGRRLVSIGQNLAENAATPGGRRAGTITTAAGNVLQAPYTVLERPVDEIVGAIGRRARNTPLVGNLLQSSVGTEITERVINPITGAFRDIGTRDPVTPGRVPPPPNVGPTPGGPPTPPAQPQTRPGNTPTPGGPPTQQAPPQTRPGNTPTPGGPPVQPPQQIRGDALQTGDRIQIAGKDYTVGATGPNRRPVAFGANGNAVSLSRAENYFRTAPSPYTMAGPTTTRPGNTPDAGGPPAQPQPPQTRPGNVPDAGGPQRVVARDLRDGDIVTTDAGEMRVRDDSLVDAGGDVHPIEPTAVYDVRRPGIGPDAGGPPAQPQPPQTRPGNVPDPGGPQVAAAPTSTQQPPPNTRVGPDEGAPVERVDGRNLQVGDTVMVDEAPLRVNDDYALVNDAGEEVGIVRIGRDYDRITPRATTPAEGINEVLDERPLGQQAPTAAQPSTAAEPTGRLQEPIDGPDPEVFAGEDLDSLTEAASRRITPAPERVGGIRDQLYRAAAEAPEQADRINEAIGYYDRRIRPILDGARRNMDISDEPSSHKAITFNRLLMKAADRMEEMTGVRVTPVPDKKPFDSNVETVIYEPWDSEAADAARTQLNKGVLLSVDDRRLSRSLEFAIKAKNGDDKALRRLQRTVEMIDHHIKAVPNDPANARLAENANRIIDAMEPLGLEPPRTRDRNWMRPRPTPSAQAAPTPRPEPESPTPAPEAPTPTRAEPYREGEPRIWPGQPRGRMGNVNDPKNPMFKGLWEEARSQNTLDDALAVFDRWAAERYGPREGARRAGKRQNRAGNLVEGQGDTYTNDRSGRGWKSTDDWKADFAAGWRRYRDEAAPETPSQQAPARPADEVPEGFLKDPDTGELVKDVPPGKSQSAVYWTAEQQAAERVRSKLNQDERADRIRRVLGMSEPDAQPPLSQAEPSPESLGFANTPQQRAQRMKRTTDDIRKHWHAYEPPARDILADPAARANIPAEDRVWTAPGNEVEIQKLRPGTKKDNYARLVTPVNRAQGTMPNAPDVVIRPDTGITAKPAVADQQWTVEVNGNEVGTGLTFRDASEQATREFQRGAAPGRAIPLADHEIAALNIQIPAKFDRTSLRTLRKKMDGKNLTPDEADQLPEMVRARDKFDELYREQAKKLRDRDPNTPDDMIFAETTKEMVQYLENILRGVDSVRHKTKLGNDMANIYRTMISMARESILYSPFTVGRYIGTQIFGNLITTGHVGEQRAGLQAIRTINKTFGTYNKGADLVRYSLDNPAMVRGHALGLSVPDDVNAVVADQVNYNPNPVWYNTMEKVPVAGGALKRLTPAIASKLGRNYAHSVDLSFRLALYDQVMMRNLPESNRSLIKMFTDSGVDEQAAKDWLTSPDIAGLASYNGIMDFATAQGLSRRKATQIGLSWQTELDRLRTAAAKKTTDTFFYGTTKADEMLGSVIMFHYWMMRASALYARHTMTNPALMANYYRMAQYMEKERQINRVPEWLDNMVQVMTGPFGYAIFANPVALIETAFFFGGGRFGKGFVDEDAGAIVKFMERTGFMPASALAGALYITGQGGSGRVPDPIGLGALTRPGTAVLNALNAHGFIPEWVPGVNDDEFVTDPNQEFLNWLREETTRLIPGQETIPNPVEADIYDREMNEQILQIAMDRGIISEDVAERARQAENMNAVLPTEVTEAINNPDSDLWQEAYKRVANMDVALVAARANPATGIFYPYARNEIRGERDEQLETLPEDSPERQQVFDEMDLTNTVTPEATQMTAADQTYGLIGDPETRELYKTYNALKGYGELETSVINVGGKNYTTTSLAKLTDTEREAVANQWAEDKGHEELIEAYEDERKAFREMPGNESFAEFKDWQRSLYDYEGGPNAYWQEITGYNDNAKWYYDHLNADQQESDAALTSVDAYMAFKGIRNNYKDPEVQQLDDPTKRPFDPAAQTGDGGGGGYGGGRGEIKPEWIVEDIQEYQSEVAEYNQILAERFPNEPVDIEMLPPNVRDAVVQNIYDDTGMYPPTLSGRAEQYLNWAKAQEPGKDTSVEAWLEWRGIERDIKNQNTSTLVTLSDGTMVNPMDYINPNEMPAAD